MILIPSVSVVIRGLQRPVLCLGVPVTWPGRCSCPVVCRDCYMVCVAEPVTSSLWSVHWADFPFLGLLPSYGLVVQGS